MSARSLALAGSAIVAMLAAPAAADECSDYRAAFVLYEAASQASLEHSAWLAEDMSKIHERHRPEYGEAELRAYHALNDAARAVQRTIDRETHEGAAVAIHAIVAARDALDLARYLTVRVPGAASPVWQAAFQSGGPTLGGAFVKLSEAFSDTKAAYHDALHFLCFERDFERERQP